MVHYWLFNHHFGMPTFRRQLLSYTPSKDVRRAQDISFSNNLKCKLIISKTKSKIQIIYFRKAINTFKRTRKSNKLITWGKIHENILWTHALRSGTFWQSFWWKSVCGLTNIRSFERWLLYVSIRLAMSAFVSFLFYKFKILLIADKLNVIQTTIIFHKKW